MFKKSLAYNQSFVIVISFIYVHFHIITIFIGFTNFGCSSITFVFFGTLPIFKVYNILNPPAHISSVIGPVSTDTEVREDIIKIIASKLHKLLHKRFKINLLICAQLQSTLALMIHLSLYAVFINVFHQEVVGFPNSHDGDSISAVPRYNVNFLLIASVVVV